jgi:glycine cleavage system regulatory protein
MLTTIVMTLIGPDRPGLVETVASCVVANGGNWLESRMCRLGGRFAGIVCIEAPAEKEAALTSALRALGDRGLSVVVQGGGAGERGRTPAGGGAVLELVGHDRPGIVREITRVLAERGVNVEDFTSERASAPMGGELLFRARIEISLPSGADLDTVRSDLEKLAAELMVDVSLSPSSSP